MGCGRCIKWLLLNFLQIFLLMVLIVYTPFLPPTAKIESPYQVVQTKILDGPLALNTKLNDVEIWHDGEISGPEAFADFNGELYATLNGGDIVKLTGNHITPIVNLGKPCKGHYQMPLCGRPLGLAFDKQGNLFAADAYHGIFKINVQTGEKKEVVSKKREIDGKKAMVFNSIALSSNGNDLYFTDSSTEFALHNGLFDLLADGSGRLIHYNIAQDKLTVLINNLLFANGVAFGGNQEDFLVVSETGRNRLHRYHLTGPKKGTSDIFIDTLPGMPDNLKSDGAGGFIVPLVVASDSSNPSFSQIFGPFPKLRRGIARLMGIVDYAFEKLNELYPNEFCEKAAYMIGNFVTANFVLPSRVTILRISADGKITSSIHSDNRKIFGISEAHAYKGKLYLGSPFNNYIGRVSLKDIGWDDLEQNAHIKREAPKHQQNPSTTTAAPKKEAPTTTPKPTTTTPKPTTTTRKPTTGTPKPTTTTPKPTTAAPKTTQPPKKPTPTTTPPKKEPLTTQAPNKETEATTTAPPPQTEQPTKADTKKPEATKKPATKETDAPKKEQAKNQKTAKDEVPNKQTRPLPKEKNEL